MAFVPAEGEFPRHHCYYILTPHDIPDIIPGPSHSVIANDGLFRIHCAW